MSVVIAPGDRILTGVALMLAFCMIAPLIDVASKLAAQAVPVGLVTLARFVVQAVLMAPFMVLFRQPWGMGREAARLLFWRAVASILSTYCFVAAVQVMPIADALAIAFVEPFIILLVGKLVYGEQVGPRRVGAAVVGFAGALLVVQPSVMVFGWRAVFPLGTAVFFAMYMLITRQLSRQMQPEAMQFHTALWASAMLVPVLAVGNAVGLAGFEAMMPQGINWLWLFGVGLAATCSHMFITYALRFAPSATLAPLHYLEIVMAVLLGYAVFGDFPNLLTWAGIGVIIASGLYIIYRERLVAGHRAAGRQ